MSDLRHGYLGLLPKDIRCLVREYLIEEAPNRREWYNGTGRLLDILYYIDERKCIVCREVTHVATVIMYETQAGNIAPTCKRCSQTHAFDSPYTVCTVFIRDA